MHQLTDLKPFSSLFQTRHNLSNALSCFTIPASRSKREAGNLSCCPSTHWFGENLPLNASLFIALAVATIPAPSFPLTLSSSKILSHVSLDLPNSLLCCSGLPMTFRCRQVRLDASFRRSLEHRSTEMRSLIHQTLPLRISPHDPRTLHVPDAALDAGFRVSHTPSRSDLE